MGIRPLPEEVRNTAAGLAVGTVLGVLIVVSAGRARAGSAAAGEGPRRPVPAGPDVVAFQSPPPAVARTRLSPEEEAKIVARAREEIARVTTYDSSWMETSGYPLGDVPQDRGACTDVVVRSLRTVGIDLQELVHADIRADMKAYGLNAIDHNIDHRRLGTMFVFLQRNAMSLTSDVHEMDAFRPGDIVFFAWSWARGAPPDHVGIVSDKTSARGYPLVIHNGGPRPMESDSLGRGRLVGHFRALPRPDDEPSLTRP